MPESCTPAALRRATRAFFKLHWNEHLVEPEPRWLTLAEKVLPAISAGGCYAVVNKHRQITYVGLALIHPREDRPLRKSGILARLIRHVTARGALLGQGEIKPRMAKWETCGGVHQVLVIPFPRKYDHLAAALEIYLIRKFGAALPMNKSRVPASAVLKAA